MAGTAGVSAVLNQHSALRVTLQRLKNGPADAWCSTSLEAKLRVTGGESTTHADAGGEGADSDGAGAHQVPAAVKVQHPAGGALVGDINIARLPGDHHPRVVVSLLAAVVVRAVPLHPARRSAVGRDIWHTGSALKGADLEGNRQQCGSQTSLCDWCSG